jgi:hypothetical protein
MLKKSFILLAMPFLFACKKEEVNSPCTLDELNNSSFLGEVNICHNTPGQDSSFPARTNIVIRDSVVLFSISSLDIDTLWHHVDSATYQCSIWEGDVTHRLHSITSDSVIGIIKTKTRFIIFLPEETCQDSYFEGEIEK